MEYNPVLCKDRHDTCNKMLGNKFMSNVTVQSRKICCVNIRHLDYNWRWSKLPDVFNHISSRRRDTRYACQIQICNSGCIPLRSFKLFSTLQTLCSTHVKYRRDFKPSYIDMLEYMATQEISIYQLIHTFCTSSPA